MSRPLFADDCQGYYSSRSLIICFVVVPLLLIPPIVGVCNLSMFCCKLLYAHSSFAIILMGKRERERERERESCLLCLVRFPGVS